MVYQLGAAAAVAGLAFLGSLLQGEASVYMVG